MSKTQRFFRTILLLFIILNFYSFGYAGLGTSIPLVSNGAIVVDGESLDWNGIQPFLQDVQGDSYCEEGTDIKTYYLAKDSNYLYWRLDTWSGNFSFGSSSQEKFPVLLFYETGSTQQGPYPNGVTVNISSDSAYISARYDNTEWTQLYSGTEYGAVDQIAEGKILLSEFEPFVIEFISAYYWRAPDVEPHCDEVFKVYNNIPDPTPDPTPTPPTDPSTSLDVSQDSLSLSKGEVKSISVTGGTSPYTVTSSDISVATAIIGGARVIVTGVAKGFAIITITDSDSNSVDVSVKVYDPLEGH